MSDENISVAGTLLIFLEQLSLKLSLPAAIHWWLFPELTNWRSRGRCYLSFPVFTPEDLWCNQTTQRICGVSLWILAAGESAK